MEMEIELACMFIPGALPIDHNWVILQTYFIFNFALISKFICGAYLIFM